MGKERNIPAELVIAAMLGLGGATGLAPGRLPTISPVPVEYVPQKEVEGESGRVFKNKLREELILPHYTGRLAELLDSDLAGAGSLVRLYAPRLFVPSNDVLTLHLATRTFRDLQSGLLEVVDVENSNQYLRPGPSILFAGRSADQVEDIARRLNFPTAVALAEALVDNVAAEGSLDRKIRLAVESAMRREKEGIAREALLQIRQLQSEMVVLRAQMAGNQRALAESSARLAAKIDLKQMVRETPKRLLEDAVDRGIVDMAKSGLKLAGKLLAVSLLG